MTFVLLAIALCSVFQTHCNFPALFSVRKPFLASRGDRYHSSARVALLHVPTAPRDPGSTCCQHAVQPGMSKLMLLYRGQQDMSSMSAGSGLLQVVMPTRTAGLRADCPHHQHSSQEKPFVSNPCTPPSPKSHPYFFLRKEKIDMF